MPPPASAGTKVIYVSFLMRDDAGGGIWGGVSFGNYPLEMTIGSPLGYYQYGMTTSKGLGDFTNKPLVPGETTFVVIKIVSNAPAAGITYAMYLDPAAGSSEPTYPAAWYPISSIGAIPTALKITNGTGFTTDEIRVGLSWSSVVPLETTWSDIGHAKPGTAGLPALAGSGSLAPNSANQLELTKAAPNAPATLVFGLAQYNLAFKGGTLAPSPDVLVFLATDPTGKLSLPFTFPAGAPPGTDLFFQDWIADAGASWGYAASNGLRATTP